MIAWGFCVAFYFLEYAVRSSPSVMVPQLEGLFHTTATGIAAILSVYYLLIPRRALSLEWRSTIQGRSVRCPSASQFSESAACCSADQPFLQGTSVACFRAPVQRSPLLADLCQSCRQGNRYLLAVFALLVPTKK